MHVYGVLEEPGGVIPSGVLVHYATRVEKSLNTFDV